MIFPDDVMRIISEFSRPLKRRRVGSYWNKPAIKNYSDMVSDIVTNISLAIKTHEWYIEETLRIDIYENDDGVQLKVYVGDDDFNYLEMVITVSTHEILYWTSKDENYHIFGLTPWKMPDLVTQLMTNTEIVKVI
jgi:hypothetical protein